MNLKFILIFLITVIVIFFACDDTITNSNVDDTIIPPKDVGFGKYIYPVIYAKCSSIDGCHGAFDNGAAGGVVLTSWETISDYVVPYDPEVSRLVQIVDGTIKTHPAVPDGFSLNENQVQGIITWIKEGAQNN